MIVMVREQYAISVNSQKNQLFLEMWGDVVEHGLFGSFPDDWKEACALVRPGFTVLADYTKVGVFALPQIWSEAQKVILRAGVEKVAVFWGKKLLGKLSTQESAKQASTEYAMRRRSFETREEAEAWLDSTPAWMKKEGVPLPVASWGQSQ